MCALEPVDPSRADGVDRVGHQGHRRSCRHCGATDFTLASATMTVNQDVAAGPSQGTWSGATIKFNNKASNQNACKNATVNLGYVSA